MNNLDLIIKTILIISMSFILLFEFILIVLHFRLTKILNKPKIHLVYFLLMLCIFILTIFNIVGLSISLIVNVLLSIFDWLFISKVDADIGRIITALNNNRNKNKLRYQFILSQFPTEQVCPKCKIKTNALLVNLDNRNERMCESCYNKLRGEDDGIKR